jgi:hypothetical protein
VPKVTAMIAYNTIHTGPKSQLGGAQEGLIKT